MAMEKVAVFPVPKSERLKFCQKGECWDSHQIVLVQ